MSKKQFWGFHQIRGKGAQIPVIPPPPKEVLYHHARFGRNRCNGVETYEEQKQTNKRVNEEKHATDVNDY